MFSLGRIVASGAVCFLHVFGILAPCKEMIMKRNILHLKNVVTKCIAMWHGKTNVVP